VFISEFYFNLKMLQPPAPIKDSHRFSSTLLANALNITSPRNQPSSSQSATKHSVVNKIPSLFPLKNSSIAENQQLDPPHNLHHDAS